MRILNKALQSIMLCLACVLFYSLLFCNVTFAAPKETAPDTAVYSYTAFSSNVKVSGVTWRYTVLKTSQAASYGIAAAVYIEGYDTDYALDTVAIPNEISGYPVVEIIKNPDEEKNAEIVSKIKKIKFSENLKYIGQEAFENCIHLETVNFETAKGLISIGENAFKGCNALQEITISESIFGLMCEGVFENCTGLNEVTLEGKSIYVPNATFNGCTSLSKINFSEDLNKFTCGSYAFSNCGFDELIFGSSVDIGEYAFSKNGKLKKVIFNGSSTDLRNGAFSNSFYNESGLVEINGNYTTLGKNAFYNCSGLEKMGFSENNKDINFSSCCIGYTGIKSIVVLGYDASLDAESLAFADLEELKFNNTHTLEISGDLFFRFSANKVLKSVDINSAYVCLNSSSAAIQPDPFSSALSLECITFGNKVVSITGNISDSANGSEGKYAKYTKVYLWNPKVYVSLKDTTPHEYTIYGYNYKGDNYTKCGMYAWKDGSGENGDGANITCESIQSMFSAGYDDATAVKNGVALVEGMSLDLDYLWVQQNYIDGSAKNNFKDKDGVSELVMDEKDPYLGYVLKYGSNGDNKLVTGNNIIEIYYGDKEFSFLVKAEKKQVTDFTINYVGTPKIEGQTISKEDFKVTNITYNNKEIIDEVLDFEVTGVNTKLEAGKNIVHVSYGGVSKEYEVEVAKKKLTGLEIVQKNSTVKYIGDNVSAEDFEVTALYDNGDRTENYTGFFIKDTTLMEENTTLEFIAGDVHERYNFQAVPVVVTNIQAAVSDGATAVEHGQVDTSFLTVTAGLNNGKKIEIPASEYTFETYDIVAGKVNTITIKYQGLTTTFNINGIPASICALEVTSIQNVTSDVPKKTYYIGDKITKDDIHVTAVYDNGLKESNFTDYTITNDLLLDSINMIIVELNSNHEVKGKCEFLANDVILEKIEVSYTGNDIQEGMQVDKTDVKVTAYYNNGKKKEIASEDYTIKEYTIVAGVKTAITVVYNGKEASFYVKGISASTSEPTDTPEPTAVPKPTEVTPDVPTATPIPINTVTPKPTIAPSRGAIKPTATAVPKATATPEITAMPKVTITPKVTTTLKATVTPKAKFTWKSSNTKIKLQKSSAKTTYTIYSNKTIKLVPAVTSGKVYYQIVKSGKKVSSKAWKKVNKQITLKTNMKACVYIKYSLNGKTVIKKTKGFVIDKKAPIIKFINGKLSVKDTGSGLKKVTVNGKTAKNGKKLAKGTYKIVAVDKAGNRKTKTLVVK